MIEKMVVVTAKDLADRSTFPQEKLESFVRVTGIEKTRRWRGTPSGLAGIAARELWADITANGPVALDALIVVTQTPERRGPCMAMDIHKLLGLPQTVAAFDMNQSCDGFIYGLWVAKRLGRVLLVCVDMLRTDESQIDSLIFSDAACAAMVCDPTIGNDFLFFNDPRGIEKLQSDEKGLMKMDGGAVFDFVTKNVPPLLKEYRDRNPDAKILCQHQANLSMMRLIEMRTGFTGRSLHSIAEYGNQSMVSIATALTANEEKILGKEIILCGYGAGWSVALASIRWNSYRSARIMEV